MTTRIRQQGFGYTGETADGGRLGWVGKQFISAGWHLGARVELKIFYMRVGNDHSGQELMGAQRR